MAFSDPNKVIILCLQLEALEEECVHENFNCLTKSVPETHQILNILVVGMNISLSGALLFLSGSLFQSCTNPVTCSVSIGNSTMQFSESTTQIGVWRIDSIQCDTNYTYDSSKLDPNDYFSGACAQLGDSDVELYYLFRMGTMCYNDYDQVLRAKANVTMTSSFELFTAR